MRSSILKFLCLGILAHQSVLASEFEFEGEEGPVASFNPMISFSHGTVHPAGGAAKKTSSIRPITHMGPILQDLTERSVRFLFQGDMSSKKINQAIVSLQKGDEPPVIEQATLDPGFFNLTHTTISGLEPGTMYKIKIAYARANSLLEDLNGLDSIDALPFTTAPVDGLKNTTSFIALSCVWNGKWGPFKFGIKDTKRLWKSIAANIADNETHDVETNAILGGGDQMYADWLNIFGGCQTKKDYIKAYHRAYSLKEFRAVTSRIPLASVPDDHAVSNDSAARSLYSQSTRGQKRFDNGIWAARLMEFAPDQPEDRLWYQKTINQVPLFFADLRRERTDSYTTVMGVEQFDSLKDFLVAHQRIIPLVIFSVPFSTQDGNGSCTDYPLWQKDLLIFCHNNSLRFNIFSGDTHIFTTQVTQAKNADGENVGLPFLEVTASGGNAHSHGKAASTKSRIDRCDEGGLLFESTSPINVPSPTLDNIHPVITENNFSRITYHHDTGQIHVEAFKAQNGQKLMGLVYNPEDGSSVWDGEIAESK